MLPVVSKSKPSLIGMDRAELRAALGERPDARWRADQIANWIYRRAVSSFDEMLDLPKALRADLAERFDVQPLDVSKHLKATDGVEKLLVHGADHEVFECVLLPYDERTSC